MPIVLRKIIEIWMKQNLMERYHKSPYMGNKQNLMLKKEIFSLYMFRTSLFSDFICNSATFT